MVLVLGFWERINRNRHVRKVTGSKITALYAAMSLSYCFIQLLFLVTSWDVNHRAGKLVETILQKARMGTTQDFVHLESKKRILRLCNGISDAVNLEDCPIIFPVANIFDPVPVKFPPPMVKRADILYMTPLITNGNLTSFVVIDPATPDTMITLAPTCIRAGLKWTFQNLFATRREDVVSACYQAWLLIMSGIAVFTQSIPHIGSTFMVHVIALGWSSFQLYNTNRFKGDYIRLVTGPGGACNGVDLISSYFKNRIGYQIGVTCVNFVSLLMSAYLTYRLVSLYGWATFKKMGASIAIDRAYKIALVISISIQLVVFFYVASVGVYIDMLTKRAFGARPTKGNLYLILYISATVFVTPWVYLAWYGIRRESRRLMGGFFLLALVFLAGSGGMFKSTTFRMTFMHWPFLSAMFVISYLLVFITIVLAVFCWKNFGIGLPHYFERRNGEDPVDFHDEFHPTPDNKDEDPEKYAYSPGDEVIVAFPGASYGDGYTTKRSGSTSSRSTLSTANSIKKAPLYGDFVLASPPPARTRVAGAGRNLTPAASTNSNSSATKPSWKQGDDRHLWREDSASSFGNKNAGDLDRGFSVNTADYLSRDPSAVQSSQVLARSRSQTVSRDPSAVPSSQVLSRSRSQTTADISRDPSAVPSSQVLPRRTPTETSVQTTSSWGTKYPNQI